MALKAWWRVLSVGLMLVLLAAPGQSENELTPSERFEKGLTLLQEKGWALFAEVGTEEGNTARERISAYTDMVLVVNKRLQTSFFLVRDADKKEIKLATLRPSELPAKALGAWLWYKICAAAELLESCRAAGIIS